MLEKAPELVALTIGKKMHLREESIQLINNIVSDVMRLLGVGA